jgi:hypothetical protein
MQNITVGRYSPNSGNVEPDGSLHREWAGWIEPEDRSWIMFVRVDGTPLVFLDRDPVTGGVI